MLSDTFCLCFPCFPIRWLEHLLCSPLRGKALDYSRIKLNRSSIFVQVGCRASELSHLYGFELSSLSSSLQASCPPLFSSFLLSPIVIWEALLEAAFDCALQTISLLSFQIPIQGNPDVHSVNQSGLAWKIRGHAVGARFSHARYRCYTRICHPRHCFRFRVWRLRRSWAR